MNPFAPTRTLFPATRPAKAIGKRAVRSVSQGISQSHAEVRHRPDPHKCGGRRFVSKGWINCPLLLVLNLAGIHSILWNTSTLGWHMALAVRADAMSYDD